MLRRRSFHPLLSAGLAGFLLVGCGERGARPGRSPGPDAAARRAPLRDAAPPVAPRASSPLALGSGCACEPVPAEAIRAHGAARRAAVTRMDALNDDLRRFIEALDTAVGPKDAALPDPLPHARRLEGIRCRLDCLLHQFLGFTGSAWAYLEQVARFLDRATIALRRLSLPPAGRPPGPGAAELTDTFNEVARLSNHSIGLALLAPVEPKPEQALDSLAFGAKTRRLGAAAAEVLATHLQPWTVPSGAGTPSPRVVAEPAALRVSLARLRQALGEPLGAGKALRCERGDACASLGPRWEAALRALDALRGATLQVDRALREAQGAPVPEILWKPINEAKQAWDGARSAHAAAPRERPRR